MNLTTHAMRQRAECTGAGFRRRRLRGLVAVFSLPEFDQGMLLVADSVNGSQLTIVTDRSRSFCQ
jgi:hypothetical protein